jgi:hypothetical protein
MAANDENDKILINVGLNASEAEASLDQFKQKVQSVAKQDLGTENVQSYKFQIRQLTADLQKIAQVQGVNSAAFREGAKHLGELKENAKDFRLQIDAFDPSNKLRAVSNIAKGAAVGLEAAAGFMGLFGVKAEKAEQVLLRLQGIMALSHALESIKQVTEGYKSFANVVRAAFTPTAKVNNVVSSAPGVSNATSTVENTADAESQTAVNAATAEGTSAQEAYNKAKAEGLGLSTATAEANEAQAATQEAVTVAEEGTTGASIGLKVALSAIGIGLIITAIAFLISNWKEVKKAIVDLFPALGQAGDSFKTIKNVLLGVGDAFIHYLKVPIDYAIYGFKALVDIVKGDFKGAMQDAKDGLKAIADDLNIQKNFKDGIALGEAKDAKEANDKRVQLEIDANERIIKERQALGKTTTALEVKNQQLKNSLLDEEDDDYKKKLLDGQSAITVIQNEEIKKRQDAAEKLRKEAAAKAAALKKEELDKLKTGNDEASKVIQEGIRSQRDIELADAEFKANRLITIAQKYGKDSSKIVEAQKIEEARINKKYDDEVFDYLKKLDEDSLSEFDKKRIEINLAIDKASKNASDAGKTALNKSRTNQLKQVDRNEAASDNANSANDNLLNVENKNRLSADGKDPLQVQFDKEQAIRNARLLQIQADYKNEQELAGDNIKKLLDLDAKHNKDIGDLDAENAKAAVDLSKAKKDAQLADLQAVGDAANTLGNIIGQQTIAGKALGIASATINTYVGASKAIAEGGIVGIATAAIVIAAGLENVKKIIDVKVPNSSSAGSTPSYQAPTINSTVLNQAQQGIQQVQVTNQPDQSKQQPLKAYVVEKDITTSQARAAYLNRQSTI